MIVIYPFGIPIFYFVLLYQVRHIVGNKERIKQEKAMDYPNVQHVLFLFESYRHNLYFWECVECIRRLLMSSLLVILPDKSMIQCLVAMLVAAFFGRTYCGYKPILANNRLQEMCQWQLMLLFLGALMIRVQISDEGGMDAEAFSIILIVVLLCGPVITGIIAVQEVNATLKKEKARAIRKKEKKRERRQKKRRESRMSWRLERNMDPEDPPSFESSDSAEMKKEKAHAEADTRFARFKRWVLRRPDPPEVLAAQAEADQNFLQIIEMKQQGIDPFKSKYALFGEDPDDVSTSEESSYVSSTDSDERRERLYKERMWKTKAKLDWDIKNLRDMDEKINITNHQLRVDIAELGSASVDLRRVNTELQHEYRRCQTEHTERIAKMRMVHERDMNKLRMQATSAKVQDRKVAANAARDAARLEKEQDQADLEYEKIQEEVERRQAEHDRLRPLYERMYGKKAYSKLWQAVVEKFPLPPPPPPPPPPPGKKGATRPEHHTLKSSKPSQPQPPPAPEWNMYKTATVKPKVPTHPKKKPAKRLERIERIDRVAHRMDHRAMTVDDSRSNEVCKTCTNENDFIKFYCYQMFSTVTRY